MGAEDAPDGESRNSRQTGKSPDDAPAITAVRCSPDRTVFTEDDNHAGWISTDTTVDVER